ncbi:MAG: alpha/beta fold hydrolase [Syntrophotaleaceae bacterium]
MKRYRQWYASSTLSGLIGLLVLIISGCAVRPYPPVQLTERMPAIPEMAKARQNGALEFILRDSAPPVPVRIFGRDQPGTPVILIHGLQSHSAWFVQSADFIARLGHPVYAFDRKGSGLSEAKRGHADSFEEWIEEIHVLAELANRRHSTSQVHLVGHCFGAIPTTAFACRYPERVASLALPTAAIHTQTDVSFTEKLAILSGQLTSRQNYIPIHLQAEMFTDLPEYEAFIRNDALALTQATAQFYWQVSKARRYINQHLKQLTMPVFMALADDDPICDNAGNRRFFTSLPAQKKWLKSYADAEHILEFSRERDAFFEDLAAWFRARNRGQDRD